jgi:hypothetical protein
MDICWCPVPELQPALRCSERHERGSGFTVAISVSGCNRSYNEGLVEKAQHVNCHCRRRVRELAAGPFHSFSVTLGRERWLPGPDSNQRQRINSRDFHM